MRRFALICILSFFAAWPAQAETITLVGDEWCPYICSGDTGRPGLLVEIARKALEKDGIKVEYKTMPWARAVKDTRAGRYTAVLGALHEPSSDLVFPSMAQAQSVVTFYTRKGTAWRFSDLSDLSRVSLGTIADYAYDRTLDDYILRYKNDMTRIQPVAGEKALASNVKKLLIGRINATVEMAAVMEYYLSMTDLRKQVVPAGRMPQTQDLFIAFSPREKRAWEYAAAVSAETERLVLSGEMSEIWAHYHLSSDAAGKDMP